MKLKTMDDIKIGMMLIMGFIFLIYLYLRAFFFYSWIIGSRHSNFYFKINFASTSLHFQLKMSCLFNFYLNAMVA